MANCSAFSWPHQQDYRLTDDSSAPSGHRDLLAASAEQGESSEGAASAEPSDPFPAYRAAVAEATDGFSSVSQRVLSLLTRLRAQPTAQECAEAVERIQELERRKLQMVSLLRPKCCQVLNH